MTNSDAFHVRLRQSEHRSTDRFPVANTLGRRPTVEDDDSPCQRQQLVQVAREHHHSRSRRGRTPKPFSNPRGRSNVEPARRILHNEKLGFTIELSRQHEFLLISTRKVRGRRISPTSPDVEVTQECGRVISNPSSCKLSAATSRAFEREVFHERKIEN